MTIEAGQPMPQTTIQRKTEDGVTAHETADYFGTGRTVMFVVPGAFTPTCSVRHLPGFIEKADKFAAAGVDRIACMAVNDPHVMKAWGDSQNVDGKIDMLADPLGNLSRELGILVHMGPVMGDRATRCALIIDDGVISKIFVEEPGSFEVSSATYVLAHL